ncbi:GNAT family N-acetyltransferase [Pseudomonas qingdaonensis]|uniref:GNAT family N-acetyltransferase n=1 Tax=Pseudomonas qingdaonensis TaxID=2056231 RepID=UPI003513FEB9
MHGYFRPSLTFRHLSDVSTDDIMALNNNPDVLRQMPLGRPDFDEKKCKVWVAQKEAQWVLNGYGPWAFFVENEFAGWGGLQKEGDDADLALVLHPHYWGLGKVIFNEIVRRAVQELRLESITLLLPPTRVRIKGVLRLGFRPDGEVDIDGTYFRRYRLLVGPSAQHP